MGLFDDIQLGSLPVDDAVTVGSRARDLDELIAEGKKAKGQTDFTPDLTVGRLGGAVVEELKMGVRDRLTGVGLIEQSVEDRAREQRTRRTADIKSLQQRLGQDKQINRNEERVQYKGAAEDILAWAASERIAADPAFEVSSGFIEDQVRSLTQVGQQVLTAMATGPVGSISDMGLMITGGTYTRLVAEDADPARAKTAAFANAILQSPLEYIGISKVTKLLKPQKQAIRFLKEIGEIMGVEGFVEYIQNIGPEEMTALWAKNPDKTTTELLGMWEKRIQEWEVQKGALKQAGHAALSSALIGGAGAHRRVRSEIKQEKAEEQDAKTLEAEALAAEADTTLSKHEEARLARRLGKSKKRNPEKTKEKPVEKPKSETAIPEVESPKVPEATQEVTEEDLKTFEKLAEEAGVDKSEDEKASVAKVLTKLREDVKPIQEEIKPDAEEKPDVPIQKLPKKIQKEPSLEDLDKPGKSVKEAKETQEETQEESTKAEEELGLGVKVEEPVKTRKDAPKPRKVPALNELTRKGIWQDGQLVATIDIPTVKGVTAHTDKQLEAIRQASIDLKKQYPKGELGYVDTKDNFFSDKQIAEDKIGTSEELNAPEGPTGKRLGEIGAAAEKAADRQDARRKKKLEEEKALLSIPLNPKQQAEVARIQKKIKHQARRATDKKPVEFDDVVSEANLALESWIRTKKPGDKFSVKNVVLNAAKDVRALVGSRAKSGEVTTQATNEDRGDSQEAPKLGATQDDILIQRVQDEYDVKLNIAPAKIEESIKTLKAKMTEKAEAKGEELSPADQFLLKELGHLTPKGLLNTEGMEPAKKAQVIKEYLAAEKARAEAGKKLPVYIPTSQKPGVQTEILKDQKAGESTPITRKKEGTLRALKALGVKDSVIAKVEEGLYPETPMDSGGKKDTTKVYQDRRALQEEDAFWDASKATTLAFDPAESTLEKNKAGNYWKKVGPAQAALNAAKKKDPRKYEFARVKRIDNNKYAIEIQVPSKRTMPNPGGEWKPFKGKRISVDDAINRRVKALQKVKGAEKKAELQAIRLEIIAQLRDLGYTNKERIKQVLESYGVGASPTEQALATKAVVEKQNATKAEKRRRKAAEKRAKKVTPPTPETVPEQAIHGEVTPGVAPKLPPKGRTGKIPEDFKGEVIDTELGATLGVGSIVNNEKGGMDIHIPGRGALLSIPKRIGAAWTAIVDKAFDKGSEKMNAIGQESAGIDRVLTAMVSKHGLTPDFQQLQKDKEQSNHVTNVTVTRLAKAIERIDGVFETSKRSITVGEAARQRRLQQIAEGGITAFSDKTVALRLATKEFQKMEQELRERGMLQDHQFRRLTNREIAKALSNPAATKVEDMGVGQLEDKINKLKLSALPQHKIDKAVKLLDKQRVDLIARIQIHYKNSGVNYLRHIKGQIEQTDRYMKRFNLDAMSNKWSKRRQNWRTHVDPATGIVTVKRTQPTKKTKNRVPNVAEMVRKGLSQEAHDMHLFDLYTNLAQSETDFEFTDAGAAGPWATSNPDQYPTMKYVKMPNNTHFGPLAGMHLEKHIYEDIKSNFEEVSEFTRAVRKVFRNWKGFKTVWNPATQVRNAVSNIALAHVVGDVNFFKKSTWVTWNEAFKDFNAVSKGLIPQSKYGTEIVEQTMIHENTFAQAELGGGDYITQLGNVFAEALESEGGRFDKIARLMRVAAEIGPKAYQAMEVTMKSVVYVAARERGETVEAAGALADKALFNYNEVPNGIKWARNYYSPFVTFTYKAVPAVTKAVIRKPWKMIPYYAIVKGADALARLMLDEDEEEQEMKRRNLPDYMDRDMLPGMPSHIRLPYRTKDGKDKYLDLSFVLPWGSFSDMGEGPLSWVPQALLPNTPLLTFPAAVLANVDIFTRKPIALETDSQGTKIWKVFSKIAAEASPGFLNPDKMSKIVGAFYGDSNLFGQENYSVADAVLDWGLGVKIRNMNHLEQTMWRHKELQEKAKEIKSEYKKQYMKVMVTQEDRFSDVQEKALQNIMHEFQEKMGDIVEEYHYRNMQENDKND